ncbi:MAG: hypothetical protein RR728_04790 [Oscillospiraceae bacterium]
MVSRLYSKRNSVVKIGNVVLKKVALPQLARQEVLRLRLLEKHKVHVPYVLGSAGCYIFMKYVQGATLTDWLGQRERTKPEMEQVANRLAVWLYGFYKGVHHSKTGIILEDVNCRNFIVSVDKPILGVDFESFSHGTMEDNIGEIIAFVNSYDILEQNKYLFTQCFFEGASDILKLDTEQVLAAVQRAKERIAQRRKSK